MGAPVTAFTRISTEPIRLHCAIYDPDVVIVLDNTLLKSVPVTAGLNREDNVLIINSGEDPAVLRKNLGVTKGKVWTVPATEIALRILGAPITNTALLGVVAKSTGIVTLDGIEKNTQRTFQTRFSREKLCSHTRSLQGGKDRMSSKEKTWKEISIAGVPPKSSIGFMTGDWKTYMPVCDLEKCTTCLTCVMFCPEGAIKWRPEMGKIEFDFSFCKGCGICANECPTKAITMKMPEE
jgi:2-oxoacid:acceptor oxidoreductase gamma subunit (pyruvate/2-ketoisovalerate family)/2-oxoacid:acceptor oxidoreductase delta subunit (pyruvate/2-ketoisovalerate family)